MAGHAKGASPPARRSRKRGRPIISDSAALLVMQQNILEQRARGEQLSARRAARLAAIWLGLKGPTSLDSHIWRLCKKFAAQKAAEGGH